MMESQQPMKMAAAEALYTTQSDASFSLFTIGSLNGAKELWSVRVPYLLSLISTMTRTAPCRASTTSSAPTPRSTGPGSTSRSSR